MLLLYSVFVHLYTFSIRVAALFNPKAEKWTRGRKDLFKKMEEALRKDKGARRIAWFHCASLGEFEQGRPVLEAFRASHPEHRIFLTLFSPSGYQVLHKFDKADYIFYLPPDTKGNAKRFLDLVNPEAAFFIKYEYWFNYLGELAGRRIPVYIVSAIFRRDQYFFKWYGGWARNRLRKITWFFLQDEESGTLIKSAGIERCSVSGDTRFDRVYAVASQKRDFPVIDKFCRGSKVLVAGSTWPEDEKLLLPVIRGEKEIKFIIVSHEVGTARINSLVSKIEGKVLKYSESEGQDVSEYDVLVIDSIGILSFLYRYATVAYIGGGFGTGIHNILEAAAFGAPVLFGPEFRKFREARDLVSLGGAVSISSGQELEKEIRLLFHDDPGECEKRAEICRGYVVNKKGATEKILSKI